MATQLEALLVVQDDDMEIERLEAKRAALAPRRVSLDQVRARAAAEVARAAEAIDRETARARSLEAQVAEHRDRHEKNVAVLNQAHRLREATAAAAQVEAARRVLADEESELLALTRRIADLRAAFAAAQASLADLDARQVVERAALDAEAAAIDAELATARGKRAASAAAVEPALLARYERVFGRRRVRVVFPVRRGACGSCDTAVPLLRRPRLAVGDHIETCEACGVLLYAEPSPAPSGAPDA